jgi:hypothetical protein
MSETTDGGQNTLRCQWCGVQAASASATKCTACGAALILRESIGDLVIPGVTDVDPELQSYARPLRIPKGSPTQSIAGPAFGAAAVGGGPASLLALGALAAVAAAELSGASRGRSNVERERLGVPSAPVLETVARLNEEALADQAAPADEAAPGPVEPPQPEG